MSKTEAVGYVMQGFFAAETVWWSSFIVHAAILGFRRLMSSRSIGE